MASEATPDSFLQKTDAELLYLVQHPELYHPALVAQARQELRRRGMSPAQLAEAAPTEPEEEESAWAGVGRRVALGAAGVVLVGFGWWALQPASPPPAPAAAVEVPVELEAVAARPLPTFEAETARQVDEVRRQLPAANRADTTATGRYLRMARRYWLAENQANYLIGLALTDSATGTFPGQVDLALERISWFMRAKAYNQNLHPLMEERLTQMQKGLGLRRSSLGYLKRNYEAVGKPTPDNQLRADHHEAVLIGEDLLGRAGRQAPLRGKLSEL